MSRFRHAARSLASGYAAIATNVLFTLASYPLALHYLSKDEFGLWAVVAQIAGYLLLLDLGFSGSASRILIDHKDKKDGSDYGSVIKTGCLVLLVQGGCIALGGVALGLCPPSWFGVPTKFAPIFRILVAGQCILYGTFFIGRILYSVLQAHQRYDVINYTSMFQFTTNFSVQWIAFHRGWGLYSLLASSFVGLFSGVVANFIWVRSLHLFPHARRWGRVSLSIFKELFSYGGDLFLLSLGLQLLNASQVVIVTKTLGLSAAAVWLVATKSFVLGQQFVSRIFDFSGSALGEMVVRGERENLQRRFRDIVVLTTSFAVFAGASIAVCNGSFIKVWTKVQIDWPWQNDVLMGLLLIATSLTRCNIGLAGYAKQIGSLRYVYFIEGASFVVASFLVARHFEIGGIIAVAIVANLAGSGRYGMARTARYFGSKPSHLLAEWFAPLLKYALALWPFTAALWVVTWNLRPFPRLFLDATLMTVVGGGLLWLLGLTPQLRNEFKSRFFGKLAAMCRRASAGGIPPSASQGL